jgi:hypothetical protein
LSVFGSTHLPWQFTRPVMQVRAQLPTLHTWPGTQALPHFPQFALSVFGFVHAAGPASPPPHWVSPVGQVSAQVPLPQTVPAAHALPHAPQFALSDEVVTHD